MSMFNSKQMEVKYYVTFKDVAGHVHHTVNTYKTNGLIDMMKDHLFKEFGKED